MQLLRRARGMLGIAATWSVGFAAVGVVPALVLALGLASGAMPAGTADMSPLTAGLGVVARWAAIGALSGLLFGVAVVVGERRQTIATLSERRLRRWGVLAGAVGSAAIAGGVVAFVVPDDAVRVGLPLVVGLAAIPVVGGVLGRFTAGATLRAAQRDDALSAAGGAPPTLHAG